jgi:hypothetical protein
MVAMVAVISAGCSSAPAGTGSSNSTAATHEKAVKFAECMRDSAVSEFPDPHASGTFAYGIKKGSSLDPSTAAWKKAIGACKDLEPPGFIGHKRSAEEQENALKFAQCIRDNGVKDFPDPTEDGPLIDVEGARSKPGLEAAMQKCRDYMTGALEDQ